MGSGQGSQPDPGLQPSPRSSRLAPGSAGGARPAESTAVLLTLARGGDLAARDRLFGRYLPILRRWAHHRRPGGPHHLDETDDLVQVTMWRAFRRLDTFELRGEGAFLAYLRQILMNAIRDRGRGLHDRPLAETLDTAAPAVAPSPLDEAIGQDCVERIERAMDRLDAEARHAVLLRVEFGMSHQEVALALGKPSADAARMTVTRALLELAKAMREVDAP